MKDCIFCKIAQKEVPSRVLYEDAQFIVFLDINPASKGHLLVVSKEHYEDIFSTPEEILGRLNILCQKMGQLCRERLKADGVNILNASGEEAQQTVFHLHYHVVPRYKGDGIDLWFPEHAKGEKDLDEVYELLME